MRLVAFGLGTYHDPLLPSLPPPCTHTHIHTHRNSHTPTIHIHWFNSTLLRPQTIRAQTLPGSVTLAPPLAFERISKAHSPLLPFLLSSSPHHTPPPVISSPPFQLAHQSSRVTRTTPCSFPFSFSFCFSLYIGAHYRPFSSFILDKKIERNRKSLRFTTTEKKTAQKKQKQRISDKHHRKN